MEIDIPHAINSFFSTSSYDMIYYEAVANAIDAGATEVEIQVVINEKNSKIPSKVIIKDNGFGFTKDGLERFCKLLSPGDKAHKGLGRLVYLKYFKNVDIESKSESGYLNFLYHRNFGEDDAYPSHKNSDSRDYGTSITMRQFDSQRLRTNEFLNPIQIRDRIVRKLYPQIYNLKSRDGFTLSVSRVIADHSIPNNDMATKSALFTTDDLDNLKILMPNTVQTDFFSICAIHYQIKKVEEKNPLVLVAVNVDGRAYELDFVHRDLLPDGYKIVVMVHSKSLEGQVDPSRRMLALNSQEYKSIKNVLPKEITKLLRDNLPEVASQYKEEQSKFIDLLPHLLSYVNNDEMGIQKHETNIKSAQERFEQAKREVYLAEHFDDDSFKKAMCVSSNALAEYFVFRKLIIDKLDSLNKNNSEDDVHNLICPMRKIFNESEQSELWYTNNSWILDDKFMSYTTLLSDKSIHKLIEIVTTEDEKKEELRPDLAFVFSKDPNTETAVDVVIVELKKRDAGIVENTRMLEQLSERAYMLMDYYGPGKIQRIWYYGICDIDIKMKRKLIERKYNSIHSNGIVYCSDVPLPDMDPETGKVRGTEFMSTCIMDFKALIEDARDRNEVFLQFIRDRFKKSLEG